MLLLKKIQKFWGLLTLAIAVWSLHQLVNDKGEGFVNHCGGNDLTPTPCERSAGSCTPCSGAPEGLCRDNGCGVGGGWNNIVSRDCTGEWTPNEPDGRWRVFKKPNYYGYGLCGSYGYGEPYYARSVKY